MASKTSITASGNSLPRGKKKPINYNDIKDKDSKATRCYHHNPDQIEKIKKEAESQGRVPNPLGNRNGAYWGSVEALILLGTDQWHKLSDIRDKMQEIMEAIPKVKKDAGKTVQTNAWDDFYNKKSRAATNPKDGLGRIAQNFSVLQRLPKPGKNEKNPYGLKLAQFGMTIDIKYEEQHGVEVPYFMLNTSWDQDMDGTTVKPLKPSRRRKRKPKAETESQSADNKETTHEPSEAIDAAKAVVESDAADAADTSGDR